MERNTKIIIGAAIVGIGYLVYRSYKSKTVSIPLETGGEQQQQVTPNAPDSLEDATFKQLSAVVESDPVFKTKPFPSDFYDAVVKDYTNIKKGNPRTPTYSEGKPAAFMSVLDAWKDAMGISKQTHEEAWGIYGNYLNQVAKSKLL